ncbi:hypothetical protein [Paracoccus marinus]|uniref:hypothetical protein n=1 Tax=Paracoccus marinus TaxID=288426 RepID=UPI00103A5E9A|nr:hypothetical protein [Paracoccus marinus]GLS81063.1 hypothetical protein GCM10007893_18630 [Paracoccus marinus]
MDLTPFQIDVVRALLRSRIDGSSHYLMQDDLAGSIETPGKQAIADALGPVSEWFRAHGLPDVTAIVVPQDNADQKLMLPLDAAVERMGGRAAAQAEAARVRDFDWVHWRDS